MPLITIWCPDKDAVNTGDLGGGGGQGVGLVAELRFPGGVPEQQPECVGAGGGGADQGGDGVLAVVAGADRPGQPRAGAIEYRLVHVGLGLELWSRLIPGCHLGRDIAAAVERAGFTIQRSELFDPFPRWVPARPMLQAIAVPRPDIRPHAV